MSGTIREMPAWLRTWWVRVPEPRDISIAYAGIYFGMLITGVFTLTQPPSTIQSTIGPVLMSTVGWFMVGGSLLAMLAGAWENWLIERVGIVFIGAAIACYSGLIMSLHLTEGGSRLTQFGVVLFAAGGAFVVRYLLIRGYTYRPRG